MAVVIADPGMTLARPLSLGSSDYFILNPTQFESASGSTGTIVSLKSPRVADLCTDGVTATLYAPLFAVSIPAIRYSASVGTAAVPDTTGKSVMHVEKYSGSLYATTPYEATGEFAIQKVTGTTRTTGLRGMVFVTGGTGEVHGTESHAEANVSSGTGIGMWGGFAAVWNNGAQLDSFVGYEVDLNNNFDAARYTSAISTPWSCGYTVENGNAYTINFAYRIGAGPFHTGFFVTHDSITPGYEAIYINGGSTAGLKYSGIVMAQNIITGIDMTGATVATAGIRMSTVAAQGTVIEYGANNYSSFESSAFMWKIGGNEVLNISATGTKVVGTFGCNGATAQAAYVVGGAAAAGGVGATAGAYDTAEHRDALITLVNNIRTALINNGIAVAA